MSDKPKWGSPTGHAEASSRTDKARSVTTSAANSALEMFDRCFSKEGYGETEWYKVIRPALTAQPVPQAAGWKEVRHAPADKDILLYCPHLNATNPERIEVGYYRTTAGGTMHSWATHWMELPPTPCATLPSEPVLSEQAALEAIREQFENWLTGEGDWPHLKYKNFGGSYITDEACMKWDAYKAGVKAALQNAAK